MVPTIIFVYGGAMERNFDTTRYHKKRISSTTPTHNVSIENNKCKPQY